MSQSNDFVTSLIFEFLWFVEQTNSFKTILGWLKDISRPE